MSEVIIRQSHIRKAHICVNGIYAFAKRYPKFSVMKLIQEGYTESELLAISTDEPILRIIQIAKGAHNG